LRIVFLTLEAPLSSFSHNPVRNSKDLWARVRALSGKNSRNHAGAISNMDAEKLNVHYAAISTDKQYHPPAMKQTVNRTVEHLTEFRVFELLDSLKPTAQGLDCLPSWFLRLAAPFLAKPLTTLYNLSLSWSVVPTQWKSSVITPVPKISRPVCCSDYRPISVTPILSRLLEKSLVQKFVYPIFVHPRSSHLFRDQFAFRPTGSTTAALINLVHIIADLLQTYPYVHLIALDFSKAFDTVRHSTLMVKFSNLLIQIAFIIGLLIFFRIVIIALNLMEICQLRPELMLVLCRVLLLDLVHIMSMLLIYILVIQRID